MSEKSEKTPVAEVETTGHRWDGIEELNTPLPRWWLWTFYATIFWGLVYVVAYPAVPFKESSSKGFLGWSTRANLAKELKHQTKKYAHLDQILITTDLGKLLNDRELVQYALARGSSVFISHCSQCHGAGAGGAFGYPNLLDDDWLWGGSIENIAYTINHGIRNTTDPDSQISEMPAFDQTLKHDEIVTLAQYVISLAKLENAGEKTPENELFLENCSGCHSENATGDETLGAPDLTDAIWLYGCDIVSVKKTISSGRYGVMPAWGQRLSPADLRSVSVYVHGLGGGE